MKTYYLYRIVNMLTNKVYIGQTVDNKKRWAQHKAYAKKPEKTGQYIHRAMAKYGVENFIFEIIATCLTQENANEIESQLIVQYDSRNKEHGYNLMVGGAHGGHSEETKQKLHEATINQIATQGHPSLGKKRTEEARANMSAAQRALDPGVIYTEEVRQRMSEAHLGIKDSEETKQRKAESAKQAWQQRVDYSEIKCQAPGCEISGKAKYKIIDGVRLCNKHGLRMLRHGRLSLANP
jgi:group I intron endonuclease